VVDCSELSFVFVFCAERTGLGVWLDQAAYW
jgi:hypothetical protein